MTPGRDEATPYPAPFLFTHSHQTCMNDHQKTFGVVPGLNMGLFAPDDLKRIIDIINRYEVPMAKITSAQRLALLGMDTNEQKQLLTELTPLLRPQPDNGVNYVQACPGNQWCKYGVSDSLKLGAEMEKLSFDEPLPAKVKIGVAGCRMCCTEARVRDIGVIAGKKGWTLIFGGNGGNNARIGDVVAEGLTDEQVILLTRRCLDYYRHNARRTMRTARFMEINGIEKLKQAVLDSI